MNNKSFFKLTRAVTVIALVITCVVTLGGMATMVSAAENAADAGASDAPRLQVGAYYYPWYDNYRFGRDMHWQSGYIEEPTLGRYSSQDPEAIGQHIDWAKQAGIDFFVMSWWGAGKFEDTTLRYRYLQHPQATEMPIALFYEVRAQFKDNRIDFDNPANRALLVRDFKYMANMYFNHPAYFHIDGRPVVFIYLTRIFIGDYTTAIREVREAVAELGFDIYIVGDDPYTGRPVMERASIFDAVSPYNMHTASFPEDDWDHLISRTEGSYRTWHETTKGLDQPIFFPNAMPGFNDWGVRPEEEHPRFFPSPERFKSFIEMALKYVDPRLPVLMITSFNEWHEDTQIEPSEKFGEDYLTTLHDVVSEHK